MAAAELAQTLRDCTENARSDIQSENQKKLKRYESIHLYNLLHNFSFHEGNKKFTDRH